MTRRALPALVALGGLLALPAAAAASPGGAAAGRISVDWSGPGRSGHAEISLDPGAGPRSAALAALRAAQPHYLRPVSYFLQGAHIAALTGQRSDRIDESFPAERAGCEDARHHGEGPAGGDHDPAAILGF